MRKKDYELIATAVYQSQLWVWGCGYYKKSPKISKGVELAREHIAKMLAFHLQDTNPQFDRVKFLRACGIDKSYTDIF
jgi:hypothetical protein